MKQQHRLAGAIGIVVALAVLAGILTAVVFGNEDAPLPEQAAQTVQFTECETGTANGFASPYFPPTSSYMRS